jgi:prophage regulatory protein
MKEKSIYRLRQVLQKVQVSRSTLYGWVKAGKFKKPVPIGERAVGWLASDVEEYIDSRIALRSANDKKTVPHI